MTTSAGKCRNLAQFIESWIVGGIYYIMNDVNKNAMPENDPQT